MESVFDSSKFLPNTHILIHPLETYAHTFPFQKLKDVKHFTKVAPAVPAYFPPYFKYRYKTFNPKQSDTYEKL